MNIGALLYARGYAPLAVLLLAGCGMVERQPTHSDAQGLSVTSDTKEAKATQKVAAPVTITAESGAQKAALSLRFELDATEVMIEVWGVDGLEIQSSKTPVVNRSFQKGESLALDIAYIRPAHESNLALKVSGLFAGRKLARVSSFTIEGTAEEHPAELEPMTDASGRAIKVMKAH